MESGYGPRPTHTTNGITCRGAEKRRALPRSPDSPLHKRHAKSKGLHECGRVETRMGEGGLHMNVYRLQGLLQFLAMKDECQHEVDICIGTTSMRTPKHRAIQNLMRVRSCVNDFYKPGRDAL